MPRFVTVLLLVVYNRRNHIESIERFKTVRQPHLQCVLDVSQKRECSESTWARYSSLTQPLIKHDETYQQTHERQNQLAFFSLIELTTNMEKKDKKNDM